MWPRSASKVGAGFTAGSNCDYYRTATEWAKLLSLTFVSVVTGVVASVPGSGSICTQTRDDGHRADENGGQKSGTSEQRHNMRSERRLP